MKYRWRIIWIIIGLMGVFMAIAYSLPVLKYIDNEERITVKVDCYDANYNKILNQECEEKVYKYKGEHERLVSSLFLFFIFFAILLANSLNILLGDYE